jgi:hypothetical protein
LHRAHIGVLQRQRHFFGIAEMHHLKFVRSHRNLASARNQIFDQFCRRAQQDADHILDAADKHCLDV